MDFRTCPTCQASVLEDDVVDCPFCGAPMSGKPGAKPKPKPQAAKPESPAGKPKPKSDPKRPVSSVSADSSAPPGDDEDPFGIDTTIHAKAVPMARVASKTRTLLVKCPMCETEGFIAPEDAGKHVRCGNASCMVPVFKSPKPAAPEAGPPPETGPGLSPLIKFGAPLAIIALLGAGWFAYTASQDQEVSVPPAHIPGGNPGNNTPEDNNPVAHTPVVEVVKKSTADVVREVLPKVSALADERRPANRLFEYSRQLSTEILAEGGNLPGAVTELARLEKITKNTPYHRIEPLVEMGWQALKQGDREKAEGYAKQALALSSDPALPKSVRRTLDGEIATISLLAKLGLAADVVSQLNRHQEADSRARLAMLWAAAINGGSFDLEQEAQLTWHIESPCPVWVAVIETSIARGDAAGVRSLAELTRDISVAEACQAAWVGRSTLAAGKEPLAADAQAMIDKGATPSAKVRMWSAVASARLTQGDKAGADEALSKAVALVAELGIPNAMAVPGMKAIYESDGKSHAGLPDPGPARANVLAMNDIAMLQWGLGKNDEGWKSFLGAMDWSHAMAPGMSATQKLVDECDKSEGTLKTQLKGIAPKGTSDFLAFNQYRKQCGKLHDEARARFELQSGLLREAILHGQLRPAWDYMVSQTNQADLSQRDPFLEGDRPALLSLIQMQGDAHDKSVYEDARKLRADKPIKPNTVDWLCAWLPVLAKDATKFGDVAAAIRREQKDSEDGRSAPYEVDEIILRTFSQAQKKSPAKDFIDLIILIDPTVDEDAFRLYGGWKGKAGELEPVLTEIETNRALEVTHKLSIDRGMVDALPQ